MATGLDNFRIYKLAEDLEIADRYTILLKSTNSYIRFLHENEHRKQMN